MLLKNWRSRFKGDVAILMFTQERHPKPQEEFPPPPRDNGVEESALAEREAKEEEARVKFGKSDLTQSSINRRRKNTLLSAAEEKHAPAAHTHTRSGELISLSRSRRSRRRRSAKPRANPTAEQDHFKTGGERIINPTPNPIKSDFMSSSVLDPSSSSALFHFFISSLSSQGKQDESEEEEERKEPGQ